jgi:hypothetical protein
VRHEQGDAEVMANGRRCRMVSWSDSAPRMKGIGTMLMLPADAKVIEVEPTRYGDSIELANAADAQLYIIKQADLHPMKVWSDGTAYQIKTARFLSDRLHWTSAMQTLIEKVGLTKSAASTVLQHARQVGDGSFMVKFAANYIIDTNMQPGPSAPALNQLDYQGYYDPNIGAVTTFPRATMARAEGLYSQVGDYKNIYSPIIDQNTLRSAVSAGQSGQKEVMDTSVLGMLVKAVDVDALVDKYLKDLVIGADRIGRLLFLYYWHYDKFKERYGEQEMQELEDSLKNTFKATGDVILFLKKKTIEPDKALRGSDVELDAVEA